MISFLRGTVAAVTPTMAYLDVNGIGFGVQMSTKSLAALPEVGKEARVLTHLQVREDGMSLFGFGSQDEQSLFEALIGVSGVGPKVAMSALSSFSPAELAVAITSQDVSRVQKIPGIGKKTAQRIILELKGSFDEGASGQLHLGDSPQAASVASDALHGATEALLSMGFTSAEAELALKGAPDGASESSLLQYALKRLGS